MRDLNTLISSVESISELWNEFSTVYNENCITLDAQECTLECAPHLTAETYEVKQIYV